MSLLYFEDFPPGEVAEYGDRLVTSEEIVEFASEFDPQPFHTDPEKARESQAGTLIASGWHTAVMLMRMNCEEFLLRSASEGAPGAEEVRWVKPVKPGDRLRVRRTTVGARPSRSRPGIGIVDFAFDVLDQRGETVMTQRNACFLRRRPDPGRLA